ncbi:MAG: GntR family transcriptional regulator [Thermodesulfobacteriota bacterium]
MKKGKGFQTINVYNEIKRRIITLEFKPGEIVDEKRLMSELKVGRTPVREALLMLKNQNLIVSHPNRSAYVKELTLKDVKDLSESLMGIERLVTALAAQRISAELLEKVKQMEGEVETAVAQKNYWEIESRNRDLHQLIAMACENGYLFSIHENLRNEISRLSYLAFSKEMENSMSLDAHLEKIVQHHREIIRCLESKNSERAGDLSAEHIKLFQNRIMLYLTHYFA